MVVEMSFRVAFIIISQTPFAIRTIASNREGLAVPLPYIHLFTAENRLSVTSVKQAFVKL